MGQVDPAHVTTSHHVTQLLLKISRSSPPIAIQLRYHDRKTAKMLPTRALLKRSVWKGSLHSPQVSKRLKQSLTPNFHRAKPRPVRTAPPSLNQHSLTHSATSTAFPSFSLKDPMIKSLPSEHRPAQRPSCPTLSASTLRFTMARITTR